MMEDTGQIQARNSISLKGCVVGRQPLESKSHIISSTLPTVFLRIHGKSDAQQCDPSGWDPSVETFTKVNEPVALSRAWWIEAEWKTIRNFYGAIRAFYTEEGSGCNELMPPSGAVEIFTPVMFFYAVKTWLCEWLWRESTRHSKSDLGTYQSLSVKN